MPAAEINRTLEYHPRAVGMAYRYGDSIFYFCPFREILGGALRRPPGLLKRRLRQTQGYKRTYARRLDEGRAPYGNPLFPWDDDLLNEPDMAGAFREAVKKMEGVYTLVDAGPARAVQELKVKGHVLDGRVKSKSRPGGTTPTYYALNMTSPYLGPNGEIQVTSWICPCQDHVYDSEKRTSEAAIRCLHQAALAQELFSRFWFPDEDRHLEMEGEPAGSSIFMPWAFTQNYVPDGNGGFSPVDTNLASLEYEALVAHYMIGGSRNNHFSIDRRLLSLSEVYTPAMIRAIRNGQMKREVLGQQPVMRKKSTQEIRAEEHVLRQMAGVLRDFGYHPEGRCLELGDNVAMRWENRSGRNAVNIVFSGLPMYCTCRTVKTPGSPRPEGAYSGPTDPFSLLGSAPFPSFDDRSMMYTETSVQIPSALRLPETGKQHVPIEFPRILKDSWRKAIRASNPEGADAVMRFGRVFY